MSITIEITREEINNLVGTVNAGFDEGQGDATTAKWIKKLLETADMLNEFEYLWWLDRYA